MSPVLEANESKAMLSGMERAPQPESQALNELATSPAPSLQPGAQGPEIEGAVPSRDSPSATPGSCEAGLCALTQASSSDPLLPEAQRRWAARPLPDRLEILRRARHWMAEHAEKLTHAIAPALQRARADTLTSEVLPLLEAMRFLERNAVRLLAPEKLGRRGRPLWLAGVAAEIHHVPLGHVVVIGPANFPLFLPGVHALQALVAGNAVTWKPGTGGEPVARLLAHVLRETGLPRGVLRITDDSVEAARTALAQDPDKVVFTGSFDAGRNIQRTLAETATPSVMELSGADAVVVLPSADLHLTAKALAFGLRLNGAEVCMSPRRVVATRETLANLRPLLQAELAQVPAIPLRSRTAQQLENLLSQSLAQGASLVSPGLERALATRAATAPVLLENATPDTALTRADIFAPVLSLIEAPSVLHFAEIVNNNPFGLTAAIFGNPREASVLAGELRVGTVVINDLIAPTADPRIPFGGRGHSGFGVTRGGEGLLAMTATRTVLRRSRGVTRHYDPLGPGDLPFFSGLIGLLHAGSWTVRWRSFQALVRAARAKAHLNPSKLR